MVVLVSAQGNDQWSQPFFLELTLSSQTGTIKRFNAKFKHTQNNDTFRQSRRRVRTEQKAGEDRPEDRWGQRRQVRTDQTGEDRPEDR